MSPTNQHGPYFPGGNTGGQVDSPNNKFQESDEPNETGVEHLTSRTLTAEELNILISKSRTFLDQTIAEGKVSIVMPTYCRQHVIQKAINSIINQSYKNWELIIVDNEPDHSYQFEDKRIRCYSHTVTASASYARNKGIEYITGEFVCFFDDDDAMDPQYLRTMIAPFQNNEIQITHCESWLVEKRVDKSFCTPSSMVRRHLVTSTWRNDIFGHDQAYWKDILKRIQPHSLVGIQAVLVYCGTSDKGGMRGGGKL